MPKRHEGFTHKGLIVYAVQYELDEKPSATVIAWLDETGNSLMPYVESAETGRPIVTTRPGDFIVHGGKPRKVVAVSIYRALGIEPGREVYR